MVYIGFMVYIYYFMNVIQKSSHTVQAASDIANVLILNVVKFEQLVNWKLDINL